MDIVRICYKFFREASILHMFRLRGKYIKMVLMNGVQFSFFVGVVCHYSNSNFDEALNME